MSVYPPAPPVTASVIPTTGTPTTTYHAGTTTKYLTNPMTSTPITTTPTSHGASPMVHQSHHQPPSVNTNSSAGGTQFKPSKINKRNGKLQNNDVKYELAHKAVRQISMHSEEDWDAIADHAAIEWGQRRGPRRGRDADDLTVTVRDIAPSFAKFFDKLGCCGEKKTRVLHRPQAPCHPVQQIHTETGGMMSSTANGVYFPQGILVESGIVGMGTNGVGHMHGVDQYGGYRYHGERETAATPAHFDNYYDWHHPASNYDVTMNKTPLPQFEQSFHTRAFNAAPGMVSTRDMNRVFHKSDAVQLDGTGRVVIPEFTETNDGKLKGGAVRI